jgi:hypothetical protein
MVHSLPSGGDTTTYIDNSKHVEVNPTYQQVASPATIYHDVSAALGAIV